MIKYLLFFKFKILKLENKYRGFKSIIKIKEIKIYILILYLFIIFYFFYYVLKKRILIFLNEDHGKE